VQQLHLVGFTTDFKGLIFSTRQGAKSGSFVVRPNSAIVQALVELANRGVFDFELPPEMAELVAARPSLGVKRESEEAVDPKPEPVTSRLSVREVQARLRSGMDVNVIAEQAGVDTAWVRRFYAPIRAEQVQVIQEARAAHLSRGRRGAASQSLGDAAREYLISKGVSVLADIFEQSWSARNLEGSIWLVVFSYPVASRRIKGEWEFDRQTQTLTAHGRLALEMGFAGDRPPAPPPPTEGTSAPPTARASAPRSANPAPVDQPGRESEEFNLVPGRPLKVTPRRAAARPSAPAQPLGQLYPPRPSSGRPKPGPSPLRREPAPRRPTGRPRPDVESGAGPDRTPGADSGFAAPDDGAARPAPAGVPAVRTPTSAPVRRPRAGEPEALTQRPTWVERQPGSRQRPPADRSRPAFAAASSPALPRFEDDGLDEMGSAAGGEVVSEGWAGTRSSINGTGADGSLTDGRLYRRLVSNSSRESSNGTRPAPYRPPAESPTGRPRLPGRRAGDTGSVPAAGGGGMRISSRPGPRLDLTQFESEPVPPPASNGYRAEYMDELDPVESAPAGSVRRLFVRRRRRTPDPDFG
jgi:hypothetical protein